MIGEWDILLRILIAAALGAVIGLEREYSQQPAGLRTHIILVVGSTLAMTLSVNLAIQFQPLVPNGDPARLAAQVISGALGHPVGRKPKRGESRGARR